MVDKFLSVAAQLIELNEGRRNTVYKDSLGINSVGVGRNLEGKGLSDIEIDFLLASDIKEVVADLNTFPWFSLLSDARKVVMIDMRFQLGPSGFRKFKRMIAAMDAGQVQLVANEMRDSTWYEQVPNRAKRNIRIWLTGEILEGDLK